MFNDNDNGVLLQDLQEKLLKTNPSQSKPLGKNKQYSHDAILLGRNHVKLSCKASRDPNKEGGRSSTVSALSVSGSDATLAMAEGACCWTVPLLASQCVRWLTTRLR